MLEKSDLDEDAKQAILVAMNCPCCGAGGMNYTAPLNRKKPEYGSPVIPGRERSERTRNQTRLQALLGFGCRTSAAPE